MNEISNKSMWFYKTFLPAGWFLIFGVVTAGGLGVHNFAFAFFGILFLAFGIIYFMRYAWSLPDHVYLIDQAIVIDRSGDKTRIAFDEIKNVGYDQTYKIVTLALSNSATVKFKPKLGFEGFSISAPPPKVVTELIDAINQNHED
jgi:hypothetical protein